MNISIHIPAELSDRLNTYLKFHQMPKNKLIVQAIKEFLESRENEDTWHPDILNWQGVPEFNLETDRDFCLLSREEVF